MKRIIQLCLWFSVAMLLSSTSHLSAQSVGLPLPFAPFNSSPSGGLLYHLENGVVSSFAPANQWIGIGQPLIPGTGVKVPAYGLRNQWNGQTGIFALANSGPVKDLLIQWGPETASRLQFNFLESLTDPAARKNIMTLRETGRGRVGIAGVTSPQADLHVGSVTGSRIRMGTVEYIEDGGAFTVETNGHFVPFQDCRRDLGRNNLRWRRLYVGNSFSCGLILIPNLTARVELVRPDPVLPRLMKLRPVQVVPISDTTQTAQRGEAPGQIELNPEELLELFPETVFDPNAEEEEQEGREEQDSTNVNEKQEKGIFINKFIPILIQVAQEQQKIIEKQQGLIDQLGNELDEMKRQIAALEEEGKDSTETKPPQNPNQLFQNVPNPFNRSSVIQYKTAETAQQIVILIYDRNGNLLAKYGDLKPGKGKIEVFADQLEPGIYPYKLIVDGSQVDSKQMVVTK